jgi:hypothetical protein
LKEGVMNWEKFLEIFSDEFEKELQKKTSFGRKELEVILEKVKARTLARILDEKEVDDLKSFGGTI